MTTPTETMDVLPVTQPAENMPGPPQGQWTYADYAALPDDGRRYEIIQGVLYVTPAPSLEHQEDSGLFTYHFVQHIHLPGLGRVFPAPCDVTLPDGTTVQPDVLVVLKTNTKTRFTRTRILGVPDLVVEIASPSTAGYDRRTKQDAYARAGVPEYWIADPATRTLDLRRLEEGAYRSLGVFQGKATLPTRVVPEFPVPVEQFFA